MRVVGVDLGARRIGVAVSDPTGTLASPHSVIERSANVASALAAIVAEVAAERVVVGMPTSMSGQAGAAAVAAAEEAEALANALQVPVETWDERLTTVVAERGMRSGGRKASHRRHNVDAVAASVILQSWLDARAAH